MLIVLLLALSTLAFGAGSTEIVDATITDATASGLQLRVGSKTLEVTVTAKTKLWHGYAKAESGAFQQGEAVTARINEGTTPPELRELADRPTWKWLENIRKHPQAGTIVDSDAKYLTLKLRDGTQFAYRATAKTKVVLRGKPQASLADLHVGDSVFAKGRTLASYDTWLVEISDAPIPDSTPAKPSSGPKRGPSKGSSKAKPPPQSAILGGKTLSGKIKVCRPELRMFDIDVEDLVVHISYNGQTKFTLNGGSASASSLHSELDAVIFYSKDKFGRIVALRVELSGRLERMVRTGAGKRASASSEQHFPFVLARELQRSFGRGTNVASCTVAGSIPSNERTSAAI